MILDSNDALLVTLSGSPSTEFPVVVSYVDVTSTTGTPAANTTATNGAIPVTFVTAAGGSTFRVVESFSVFNADTATRTVTITFNDGATSRILCKVPLEVGATLSYLRGVGLRIVTQQGQLKIGQQQRHRSLVVFPVDFDISSTSGTISIATDNTYIVYLGRATSEYTSANLRYRVTTAAVTISWAEVAIYRGEHRLRADDRMDLLGYTDVSAVVNSTGLKTTSVAISGCSVGAHLWAAIGNKATTVMVLRSHLQTGTDTQPGCTQIVTARPSLSGQIGASALGTVSAPAIVAQFT